MKALITVLSAAALLSGCSMMDGAMSGNSMSGMSKSKSSMAAMPTNAMSYMKMAHDSDMFEIESSRMALSMSRSEAVRSFAQMMIDHHTRMSNEMMMTAKGMSMAMPMMEMSERKAGMLKMLRSASADRFDAMYVRDQMMAHEEALMMHRAYAERGDNPTLKAMAAKAVPMVQDHLNRANALKASMGD